MERWLALIVVPLVAGGCVPTAVVVASYAADGASYVATGKTVSDHGISAATMRDCSLLRVVKSEAICSDAPSETPAPFEDRRGSVPAVAALETPPAASPTAYLVVGSFADRAKAERLARDFAVFAPSIRADRVAGRPFHRVVVGPLDAAGIDTVRVRSPQAWRLASAPLLVERD
jgi:hypothetical protein